MEFNYAEPTITIPQKRFEELIKKEERINIAVERICNDEFCKTEDILRILGTQQALKRAKEIKDEEVRQHEEYLNNRTRGEEKKQ